MDSVSALLGDQAMNNLGGAIGTSGDDTKSAVSAGLPALLGGLADSTNTPEGAERVLTQAQSADQGVMGDLAGFFGRGDDVAGSTMLSSMLGGGAVSTMVSALASRTGLGAGVFAKLLPMLAPVVMAAKFHGLACRCPQWTTLA